MFPPPATLESPAVARLRGLAIGYVVLAGFLLMIGVTFALLAVAIVALGLEGGPPLAMCAVETIMMAGFATLLALGAHGLYRRKNAALVKAAAVVACIVFPIGTVLGVLTFMWVDERATPFDR